MKKERYPLSSLNMMIVLLIIFMISLIWFLNINMIFIKIMFFISCIGSIIAYTIVIMDEDF